MKDKEKQHDEEIVSAMRQVEEQGLEQIAFSVDENPCPVCDMNDPEDPHYGMLGYHRQDCTFCLFT